MEQRATHSQQLGADRSRPWKGLGLLLVSVLSTLAILIYFGAWAASDRVEARTASQQDSGGESEAWEEGLLYVCPFH